MARKRHSDEDILKLLCEIEVRLASGSDVASACWAAGPRNDIGETQNQWPRLRGLDTPNPPRGYDPRRRTDRSEHVPRHLR
jgi:hypothetical protein